MRILDKNTDFYDYYQDIYYDKSVTFDRTASFLLTKKMVCDYLRMKKSWLRVNNKLDYRSFVLLQVCNNFWMFLVEVTDIDEYGVPKSYTVELISAWKNYDKPRCLMKMEIIKFEWSVYRFFYKSYWMADKEEITNKKDVLIQAVDTNNYKVEVSMNRDISFISKEKQNERNIPLLKASGFAECIEPLDIYLAFEEYFSLEKRSMERTESKGLTDKEKIENHGFNAKTSFRGKVK